MIDLILNEFGIANYHLLKNKQGKFLLTNEANSDFWIILSDYDVAVDKQQELFELYRQGMKEYSTAEKNTSILILKCISHFDEDPKKKLSDYLIDSSVFENLKNDSSDGPYTLLYGIAHKLPFLLLEMEKSKLELSYPTNWVTDENKETNEWVDGIPDKDNEIDDYLDELLNSIDHEQD